MKKKKISGQDDKACELWKLLDATNERRSKYTTAQTVWLLAGSTVAHAVTIQMASESLSFIVAVITIELFTKEQEEETKICIDENIEQNSCILV